MMKCNCNKPTISPIRRNPNITPELLKGFILTTFSINDPCVPADFSDIIDCLWDIFSFQSGCDFELRYLLVRLEVIKVLMGCAAYDVYRSDSLSESNSRSELTTKQDGSSQSQQTSHSSNYSDLIGTQRYNDFADSTLRAESQRSAFAESHREGHERADDIGRGESLSTTTGQRGSRSDRFSQEASESESGSQRDGARRGRNYSLSRSTTDGFAVNLGAIGYSRNPTKFSSDTKMRSDTLDSGSSFNRGTTSRGLRARANSFSNTNRVSSSFFHAQVDRRVWGASIAQAEDHQRSQSDSVSHAEGLGQSSTEQEGKGQGSTQGTSQSQNVSITERDGARNSYTIVDTVAAQQRFEALLDLFDKTQDRIDYRRTTLQAQVGYIVGPIQFCESCGYIPDLYGDPVRARLCLCRQPHCPDCNGQVIIESEVIDNGVSNCSTCS